MRLGRITLFSALLFTSALPTFGTPRTRRGPTSPHLFSKRTAKPAAKPVSQRGIDPERTTQIQTALIKQGYLSGGASGKWDNETQAALEKLQSDNGWQTKLVPDSRAIIKLGLGPHSGTPDASLVSRSTATSGSEAEPLPGPQ